MGAKNSRFVTTMLMEDPDFREWVRSIADSAPGQEFIGILAFESTDLCRRVVDAIDYRKSPTIVVNVEKLEVVEAAPAVTLPGASVERSVSAQLQVAALLYSPDKAATHTDLHAASTVGDLFGLMELHGDGPWSFDVQSTSIEQMEPVREFALA